MNKHSKSKCPHCGEYAFFKEKKIYGDDFSLKGTKYFCLLCGGEADLEAEKKSSAKNDGALDRLSKLLGGEENTKVSLDLAQDEVRFCLHCAHYIKHPFMNRCGLNLKEVEATGSCENFKAHESEPQGY